MEKPEDIKKFKRAYRKMMNRYWNDEICGDFYEQLDDELRKYNMSITETYKVETYWSVRKQFYYLTIIQMELIKEFNRLYPNGNIVSQRIMTEETGVEVFKATVIPDLEKPERYFSAYAKVREEDIANALDIAQDKAIDSALRLVLTKQFYYLTIITMTEE